MAELTYGPVITFARGVFASLGIHFDIVGAENIPSTGGAVLAINHTSYLDFAFAGLPSYRQNRRVVRFMAKDSIWKHPIGGPLMRGMKHIPVDRNAGSQSFRDAVTALKAGELVGVFPEATMSRTFEIKEIKSGAARMAKVAQVPMIPTIVFGGQRILGYGHKDFSRGKTVAITIGEPIVVGRGDDPEDVTVELRQRLKVLLDATIDRYPVPTDGSDLWWLPARRGGTAPEYRESAE